MCKYSKVSKLLLTCFVQIIVVIKHLQDNAVFLAWEFEKSDWEECKAVWALLLLRD